MADGNVMHTPQFGDTFEIKVEISGEEKIEGLYRTVEKAMRGIDFTKYWKPQKALIDELTRAAENFKRVSTKDTAAELINTMNALQAMSKNSVDFSKLIPDFSAMDRYIQKARELSASMASVADVSDFHTAFDALKFAEDAKHDIRSSLSAVSKSNVITEYTEELKRMQEELDAAWAKAKKLQSELEEALSGDRYRELLEERDELQYKLDSLIDTTRREFGAFLVTNDIDESSYAAERYFDNIAEGTMTAKEAIADFKRRYDHMFLDKQSGGVGSEQIEYMMVKLDGAVAKIESISGRISELTSEMAESSPAELIQRQGEAIYQKTLEVIQGTTSVMAEGSAEVSKTASVADNSLSSVLDKFIAIGELEKTSNGGISSIGTIFRGISRLNDINISKATIANLGALFASIGSMQNPANLNVVSNADLTKFNELKVSKASLNNLATYLPMIASIDVSKLVDLSAVDLSKFNTLSVTKTALNGIANSSSAISDLSQAYGSLTKSAETYETVLQRISKYDIVPTRSAGGTPGGDGGDKGGTGGGKSGGGGKKNEDFLRANAVVNNMFAVLRKIEAVDKIQDVSWSGSGFASMTGRFSELADQLTRAYQSFDILEENLKGFDTSPLGVSYELTAEEQDTLRGLIAQKKSDLKVTYEKIIGAENESKSYRKLSSSVKEYYQLLNIVKKINKSGVDIEEDVETGKFVSASGNFDKFVSILNEAKSNFDALRVSLNDTDRDLTKLGISEAEGAKLVDQIDASVRKLDADMASASGIDKRTNAIAQQNNVLENAVKVVRDKYAADKELDKLREDDQISWENGRYVSKGGKFSAYLKEATKAEESYRSLMSAISGANASGTGMTKSQIAQVKALNLEEKRNLEIIRERNAAKNEGGAESSRYNNAIRIAKEFYAELQKVSGMEDKIRLLHGSDGSVSAVPVDQNYKRTAVHLNNLAAAFDNVRSSMYQLSLSEEHRSAFEKSANDGRVRYETFVNEKRAAEEAKEATLEQNRVFKESIGTIDAYHSKLDALRTSSGRNDVKKLEDGYMYSGTDAKMAKRVDELNRMKSAYDALVSSVNELNVSEHQRSEIQAELSARAAISDSINKSVAAAEAEGKRAEEESEALRDAVAIIEKKYAIERELDRLKQDNRISWESGRYASDDGNLSSYLNEATKAEISYRSLMSAISGSNARNTGMTKEQISQIKILNLEEKKGLEITRERAAAENKIKDEKSRYSNAVNTVKEFYAELQRVSGMEGKIKLLSGSGGSISAIPLDQEYKGVAAHLNNLATAFDNVRSSMYQLSLSEEHRSAFEKSANDGRVRYETFINEKKAAEEAKESIRSYADTYEEKLKIIDRYFKSRADLAAVSEKGDIEYNRGSYVSKTGSYQILIEELNESGRAYHRFKKEINEADDESKLKSLNLTLSQQMALLDMINERERALNIQREKLYESSSYAEGVREQSRVFKESMDVIDQYHSKLDSVRTMTEYKNVNLLDGEYRYGGSSAQMAKHIDELNRAKRAYDELVESIGRVNVSEKQRADIQREIDNRARISDSIDSSVSASERERRNEEEQIENYKELSEAVGMYYGTLTKLYNDDHAMDHLSIDQETGDYTTDIDNYQGMVDRLNKYGKIIGISNALPTVDGLKDRDVAIQMLQSSLESLNLSEEARLEIIDKVAAAEEQLSLDVSAAAEKRRIQEEENEVAAAELRKKRAVLEARVATDLKKFSGASQMNEYGLMQQMAGDLRNAREFSADELKEMSANLIMYEANIKSAGKATKSFKDTIIGNSKRFVSWFGMTQVITKLVSELKRMYAVVKEIDTAMTELKKVTDETSETYDRFLNHATESAKRIGATIADTVNATADFARLGYSIDDAAVLGEAAIVYKNVGDGIENISEATESIISTMKAFGIEAKNSMSIVDKFNEVGNNFAISSKGVGDALVRSASSLKVAGNSLEESIALITAANTIVQDPDKVGTSMKTMSMFLRAAKMEAEEAGESTDGMADSVSKLRDEILSLTGGKVDIQLDDKTFKNTYQILKEISGVWEELSDVSQANILEKLGGKRNSNVVSSLITNFDIVDEALAVAMDASGSAIRENQKYLDSIAGKTTLLKANFEDLSKTIVSSDLVKFALDVLNSLTGVSIELVKIKPLLAGIAASVIAIKTNASMAAMQTKARGIVGALREVGKANDAIRTTFSSLDDSTKKYALDMLRTSDLGGTFKNKTDEEMLSMLELSSAVKDGSKSLRGMRTELSKFSFKDAWGHIPTLGKITIIITAIKAIYDIIKLVQRKQREVIENASSMRKSMADSRAEAHMSVSAIRSMSKEFEALSSGVGSDGKNISLSADEYERYKDIVDQIANRVPSLIKGYDEEGRAIADKNGLIERSIELIKEEQRVQQQRYAGNDNIRGLGKLYQSELMELRDKYLAGHGVVGEQHSYGTTGEQREIAYRLRGEIEDQLKGLEGTIDFSKIVKMFGEDFIAGENGIFDFTKFIDANFEKFKTVYLENRDEIREIFTASAGEAGTSVISSIDVGIKKWQDAGYVYQQQYDDINNRFKDDLKVVAVAQRDVWDGLSEAEKSFVQTYIDLNDEFNVDMMSGDGGFVAAKDGVVELLYYLESLEEGDHIISIATEIHDGKSSDGSSLSVNEYISRFADLEKYLEGNDDLKARISVLVDVDEGSAVDDVLGRIEDRIGVEEFYKFRKSVGDMPVQMLLLYDGIEVPAGANLTAEALEELLRSAYERKIEELVIEIEFKAKAEELNKQIDSLKKAHDIADKLSEIEESGGGLDLETYGQLAEMMPETVGSIRNLADAQAAVNDKILEFERSATQAYGDVALSNEEFVSGLLNSSINLSNALATYYGADVENWKKTAEAKWIVDATLVQNLSSLWAKYSQMSTSEIEKSVEQMEIRSKFLRPWSEEEMTEKSEIDANLAEMRSVLELRKAISDQWEEFSKNSFNPNKAGGKGSKDIEEYIAEIDRFREALERLSRVRLERDYLEIEMSLVREDDYEKKIEYQRKLIGSYLAEKDALAELTRIRREAVSSGADSLRKKGFDVEYNAEKDLFFVRNLEHINELMATSAGKFETVKEATNELRKETEEEISTLESLNEENGESNKEWANVAKSIEDAKMSIIDGIKEITSKSSELLDTIQSVNDALHNAANEYASNGGFISIDTFQQLIELGPQYMQYLKDENGQLVINEESINRVIQAKTEQLAVDSAMSYVMRLREALDDNAIENLNELLYATTKATDATWGLVYANLQLLGLSSDQYQAAAHNIEMIRALGQTAVNGIGHAANENIDQLNEMKSGLDDILKYVMDMLKHRIQEQIDSLNEMKEAYAEIIDDKKESLRLSDEEADRQKSLTQKLKDIAKIQAQIDALSLDDTRAAQAERAELIEKLAGMQDELAGEQADHALDVQNEALDKMKESYNEEKDEEIEILNQSISSYEKLYQMAIQYIQDNWHTLYDQLISWNTEYGSVLNSEITNAWNNCLAAAQRYGDYVSALNGIDVDIESAGNAAGSHNVVVGNVGSPVTPSDQDMIRAIVSRMKGYSASWNGNMSDEDKARMHSMASAEAEKLAQHGVRVEYNPATGEWVIVSDTNNPFNNGRLLYSCYHKGGVVGGGDIKSNEQISLLKNDEWVLSEKMVKNLSEQMKRLSHIGDILKSGSGVKSLLDGIIGSRFGGLKSRSSGVTLENLQVNVPIQVLERLDESEIKRYSGLIGSLATESIRESFAKRGIKNMI